MDLFKKKGNVQVIILFLIVFIVAFLAVFIILFQNNNIILEPRINNTSIQPKKTFIENPSVLMVVRNIDAEVPTDLNLPKATIIQQYLYDCAQLEISKRTECMDEYYGNAYESLKLKKQECNMQEESCKNQYYLRAAELGGKDYCYAITNELIKQECMKME